MEKAYIGDGVYVNTANGMLKLTTENGISVSNTIYIDDTVWTNLVGYVERLKTKNQQENNATE